MPVLWWIFKMRPIKCSTITDLKLFTILDTVLSSQFIYLFFIKPLNHQITLFFYVSRSLLLFFFLCQHRSRFLRAIRVDNELLIFTPPSPHYILNKCRVLRSVNKTHNEMFLTLFNPPNAQRAKNAIIKLYFQTSHNS